jgi:multicomponent Na+:H+ antiporter subunit D
LVVLTGGLLAGGYIFLVLARALTDASEPLTLLSAISPSRQAVVVAVALCAVLLGFVPLRPLELLQIGRPDVAVGGIR